MLSEFEEVRTRTSYSSKNKAKRNSPALSPESKSELLSTGFLKAARSLFSVITERGMNGGAS